MIAIHVRDSACEPAQRARVLEPTACPPEAVLRFWRRVLLDEAALFEWVEEQTEAA
ncbi:MAG: hypothetical protein ACQEXJ_05035 [Myxococcota bacterium]